MLLPLQRGTAEWLNGADSFSALLLRAFNLIMALQVHPKARCVMEVAGQPQGGIRRDNTLPLQNVIYPVRGHVNCPGKPVLAYPQRFHEFFLQNRAGRNRRENRLCHFSILSANGSHISPRHGRCRLPSESRYAIAH